MNFSLLYKEIYKTNQQVFFGIEKLYSQKLNFILKSIINMIVDFSSSRLEWP